MEGWVFCGQDHQSPWPPVLSCLRQAFRIHPFSPQDPFPPPRGGGRGGHSSQVGRPSPALTLELTLHWSSRGSQRGAPGRSSESPRVSAAGLHVVPGEESSPLRADALTPAIGVAACDADDGALREGEFVVLLAGVWVQRHHCRAGGEGAVRCASCLTMGGAGAPGRDSRQRLGEAAAGSGMGGECLLQNSWDPSPARLIFSAGPAACLSSLVHHSRVNVWSAHQKVGSVCV